MKSKLLIFSLLLLLIGCTNAPSFSVEIESSTLGTRKLEVVYTLPDGNRAALEPVAVDGKMQFEGSSSEPSLVEIFTQQGALLMRFMAVNGDKITITDGSDGSYVVSGNSHELAANIDAQPVEIDKLNVPALIVDRDSSKTVALSGVWVFTSSQDERRGAVMDSIKQYRKTVRDVYIGSDFEEWRVITRYDSATWQQGLLPAPPAAVTSTPLLVVTDSAGHILRRSLL